MHSECNMVGNPREWWINSGASCHVCAEKELFSSYTPSPIDVKMFMANFVVAKVEVTFKVQLKMTLDMMGDIEHGLVFSEIGKKFSFSSNSD